jgi:2-polyprenyl-6-methoxyphenol hydroxylase-like FAD-dependent oxidoreductase
MTRYDALIAGAGPAGSLTALLAHGQGRSVLLAETRAFESLRTNLARFSGDAQQLIRQVDAGDGLFPTYDPRQGPHSFIAPIRDVEHALRSTAARQGIPAEYEKTFFDVTRLPDGGVGASIHTANGIERVEAPVLIDATGGRFAGAFDETLRLQHVGGDGHAIGVHWHHGTPTAGWNDAKAAASGDVPDLRLDVGNGKFAGHHDAQRGTFGILELPTRPDPTEQDQLVRELGSGLGLHGEPQLRYDFGISNQIAGRAYHDDIALIGDSVTRLRPRTGMGVNLAMLDARDGARLIDDLARLDESTTGTLAKMERQRIFETFGAAVMRRHKSALHAEQAPSPFGP